MSTAKTVKEMSATSFLNKAVKNSHCAAAFLVKHRDYIVQGSLRQILYPILRQVDMGEMMPTPALMKMQETLLTHIYVVEEENYYQQQEKKLAKVQARQEKQDKLWSAVVYDENGNIATYVKNNGETDTCEKTFEKASEANRWTDRHLFNGGVNYLGEITNVSLNVREVITRSQAIERILKAKRNPVMHSNSKTTGKLSFGMKVKQDTCSFSRG